MNGNRNGTGENSFSRENKKNISELDDRVTAIEIRQAERFTHIMSTMDNIQSDLSQIMKDNRKHIDHHHKTELDVADLKIRMTSSEGKISGISAKMWAAVSAAFAIMGTALAALLKWPQS